MCSFLCEKNVLYITVWLTLVDVRYIVYNLGRAVTIIDSTLKGYAMVKETASLLGNTFGGIK